MLERAHRLGPLKLAAIIAALLTVAGVVVLALSRDGDTESTAPDVAGHPAQSESAETPPSTTGARTNDADADSGDDPNPKNRGGNGPAQASESGGQNGQEPESSSKKELPPKSAKLFKDATDGDDQTPSDQLPSNLPPELRRLFGGIAKGE